MLNFFCLALLPAAMQAANPHFSAIYVFGDSYCDAGNLFAAVGVPGAPYYVGRFSNGPVLVEHIASAWGLPMIPSNHGGTDYAWGGAFVTQMNRLAAEQSSQACPTRSNSTSASTAARRIPTLFTFLRAEATTSSMRPESARRSS